MRYHYEGSVLYCPSGSMTVELDHPLYNKCTLYLQGEKGLAVIQQRFNPRQKMTYWTEIDPRLVYDIYYNPNFRDYFRDMAEKSDENGLYPTVTVRQIMYALRMKPLKKERWETVFDRRNI